MIICGVYMIKSVKNPKRYYIGSSIDIKQRWRCHLADLRKNVHHSIKLQRHFNKYGKEDLIFTILMGCDKEYLIKNEQYFIDALKPYFNGSLLAQTNSNLKGSTPWNKGKKMPPEVIEKLRQSHLGQAAWNKGKSTGQVPWNKGMKGCYTFKMPEETKKKIAIASLGNKRGLGYRHSDEVKQKMREIALKRPPMSEEQKEKLRQASMGNKNMLGKTRPEETRKKVSEGLKRYFEQKRLKQAS